MIVSATKFSNNFGEYLKISEYEDVFITRNGKKISKLVSVEKDESHSITDSLRGILKDKPIMYREDAREEKFKNYVESIT